VKPDQGEERQDEVPRRRERGCGTMAPFNRETGVLREDASKPSVVVLDVSCDGGSSGSVGGRSTVRPGADGGTH